MSRQVLAYAIATALGEARESRNEPRGNVVSDAEKVVEKLMTMGVLRGVK